MPGSIQEKFSFFEKKGIFCLDIRLKCSYICNALEKRAAEKLNFFQ